MFLWAILVIEKIRKALNDGEPRGRLKAIIDHTPPELEQVFKSLVSRISIGDRKRSKRILSWILFAKRPLSLAELYDALAFGNEGKYQTYSVYEASDEFIRPEQMRPLLAKYTRGLAEAAGGPRWSSAERMQFIHGSVRQYMRSGQGVFSSGSDMQWADLRIAKDFLARSCFSYIKAVCLELGVIESIVSRLKEKAFDPRDLSEYHSKDRLFLEYTIQFGFAHAKTAKLQGIPPSYPFESRVNDYTGAASWWGNSCSVLELYWKRGRHGGSDHWTHGATTEIALACAYQIDSWTTYLVEGHQPH